PLRACQQADTSFQLQASSSNEVVLQNDRTIGAGLPASQFIFVVAKPRQIWCRRAFLEPLRSDTCLARHKKSCAQRYDSCFPVQRPAEKFCIASASNSNWNFGDHWIYPPSFLASIRIGLYGSLDCV